MVNQKQLISNTSCAFLSHAIRLLANFLVFVIIARAVGIEEFGKFTFAFTFATMFLYMANFGLDKLTTLEISRDRTFLGQYYGSVMVTRVLLSLITLLLTWMVINAMHYPEDTKALVYILALSVMLNSFIMSFNAVFQGIEKLKYETIVAFINNGLLLILTSVALKLGGGLIAVALIFLSSRVTGFFAALFIHKSKVGKINLSFQYQVCKDIILKAWPFAFWSISTVLLYNIDTVLLSYFKGDYVVGLYQPAIKIISALTVIPLMLDNSFFPVLSRLHDQKESFDDLAKKLNSILFLIGVPLMSGIFVLADKMIIIIYGEKFLESAIVLQILSLVLLLRFSIKAHESMLIALGKQKSIFYIILSAIILNVVLNILLIPIFGMMGAAISSLTANIVIIASYIYLSKKEQKVFLMEGNTLLILSFGLLSGLLIYNLKLSNIFALMSIFAVCYSCFTLLFLKKERMWLFQTIHLLARNNK
jgi:O-antigen/teichoic acid export membrane protein